MAQMAVMGHQYSVLYTLMGHDYMVVDVVTKNCKKLFPCFNLAAAAVAPNVVSRSM